MIHEGAARAPERLQDLDIGGDRTPALRRSSERLAAVAVAPTRPAAPARPEARALPADRYSRAGELVKDATDRLLAALGLTLLSPLLLLIALVVRLDSKGPALFKQTRVGKNRRPFTFYKFRGMHVDAPERFPELYDYEYTTEQIRTLHFHPENDPRVTRVGVFIRRTSLDELPNLVNVLLGDMSLVGPRPEIPELIPYYGKAADPILSVKPGVTSLGKLVGRDNISFLETLELDLEYVRTRGLARDFGILFATVYMILTGGSVGR